ncbi:hypothetical protein CA13_31240 [Planctomycetes bacterium CA13]|uniref:Uncharacterized protein n=1 Tax=Novipirellula herctigrandis TaxID=2527986 RepID=A0A5C5Z4A4_9BACT|nr:hypothetical protein CA13_31240 [Planctomycetes bacterium CA13]
METETTFNIELEHVTEGPDFHTFRVAFSNADSRILLPYPQVTGIRLVDSSDAIIDEWRSRYLVSEPLDDFVLSPGARIAFDLRGYVNGASDTDRRWTINMPVGDCRARFHYYVDDKRDWYDFLAKRSRFAAMTSPWNGTIESDAIEFANRIPSAEVG